ncbi:MAG: hypothetical protein ACYCYK_03175, partial [Candidatus Dormibacteria bacterium]
VALGGTPGLSRPSCRREARTWSGEGRGWQAMSALANQVAVKQASGAETVQGSGPDPAIPEGGDELRRIGLRGLEPVPPRHRHGRPRELFFIWAGALADFCSLYAGARPISAAELGFWEAALVLRRLEREHGTGLSAGEAYQ